MEKIINKQTKVSRRNKYGVVKIQSKELNPFIGEMVDIYIKKKKEGEPPMINAPRCLTVKQGHEDGGNRVSPQKGIVGRKEPQRKRQHEFLHTPHENKSETPKEGSTPNKAPRKERRVR